jgi:hypothetical protein
MLNGNGALDTSSHRLFERVREELVIDRFQILADAVGEHEVRAARFSSGPLPHDQALYRRLRGILARNATGTAR